MSFKIILLRHGHAGQKEQFKIRTGLRDTERPLTKKGIKQIHKQAKKLAKNYPEIDTILTSPWVRAQQTADILKLHFAKATLQVEDKLRGNIDFRQAYNAIADRPVPKSQALVLVGHQPQLCQLLTFFLTKKTKIIFDIKKGAFAIIEVKDLKTLKGAKLKCLVPP